MNEDEMMPVAGEEAPAVESVTPELMVTNYQSMNEDEQTAVMQLFDDPVRNLLDQLMGGTTFSNFADQIQGPSAAEADMPMAEPAGLMGPSGDMEAPITAMARGGDLNTQVRGMLESGMTRDEILSRMR